MDMGDVLFLNEENDSQARMEELKLLKEEIKSLKEREELSKRTITLLKKKMIKLDELMSQHNDKIKECDEKVNIAKAEKQDVLNKCNVMMEKVTRMELASLDDKQSIDKYKRLSEAQKLKLDENEKLICQYEFKIKSLDNEKSTQEENIKTLQENVKAYKVRENEKKHTKNKGCQTLRSEKRDFSVNTNLAPYESEKPLMQDKIIMTDEILKNEPFPIFCTKCEKLINPAPIDQILKIMTSHPPVLSQQISVPNSPDPKTKIIKIQEPFEPIDSDWHNEESIVQPQTFNNETKHINKQMTRNPKEVDESLYMQLVKRINKLESFMNKTKIQTKKGKHINNQCCSSKNINFVVKVPHEKDLDEYRNRENRKLKKVKRLKNKPFKMDKRKQLNNNKWIVEHHIVSVNEKAVVPTKEKKLKKRNGTHRKNETDLLFESPSHSITEEKINNGRLSPLLKCLPPSHIDSSPSQKSLSPSESLSGISLTNKLDIKKKLFVENVNIEKSVVESISDVDLRLSSSSLSSQVSVSKSTNESIVTKDRSATSEKNSLSNKHDMHIIPVEMENNEETRHTLLPNEVEMPDNLFTTKVSNKRMYNHESSCTERHSDSIHKNIDNQIINKTTENLVTLLKPQQSLNNSFELLIHTEITEKHNDIIISSCNKTSSSDNTSQVDSSVLTETRKTSGILFTPTDEDQQKENVCTEEAGIDALDNILTQNSTDSGSVNIDDVQHVSEIKIGNSKSRLKIGTISSSTESCTNEFVKSPEKYDKLNDLIKDKTLKCISPQSESALDKCTLVEETVTVSKSIDCASQSTQDLLTMLTETPDEGRSSNKLILSKSPSPDEIKSIEKIPLTEIQMVIESETLNETCTLPTESRDFILTTNVTGSSSFKKPLEEFEVMQEDRSKDNDSFLDKHFQSSHNLPIMASIAEQHKKIKTPTIEQFQEIPSSILSVSDHVSRDNSLRPVISGPEIRPIENINENSNSSDASSESKCFSLSGIKRGRRGKPRNLITSDDSSEDCKVDSPCTKDSSKECKADSPYSRKRKNLDNDSGESPITMKKVLTRIGNFRKACDDPVLLEKMIPSLSELSEFPPTQDVRIPRRTSIQSPDSITSMTTDTSSIISVVDTHPPYLPPTKQRIAHTPKNIEPSPSFENKNQIATIVRKTKCIKKPTTKPGDKISELLEVFDKTCKERQQISRNLNPPAPPDESLRMLLGDVNPGSSLIQDYSNLSKSTTMQQPAKKPRGRPPKNAKKIAAVNRTSESSVDSDVPMPKPIVKEDKQVDIIPSVRRGRPPRKVPKKSGTINENLKNSVNLDLLTQEAILEKEGKAHAALRPIVRGHTPRKLLRNSSDSSENPMNSDHLNIQAPKRSVAKVETNSIPPLDTSIPNEPLEEGEIDDTVSTLAKTSDIRNSTMQDETEHTKLKECTRKKNDSNIIEDIEDDMSPVKELRSRHVAISHEAPKVAYKVTAKVKQNSPKVPLKQIDKTNSCLHDSIIRSYLNEYLATEKLSNRIRKKQTNIETLWENEAICHKQLDILIDTEEWTTELNSQVVENLLNSQELKIIALSIVDYTAEKCPENEPLDKCNTPPAPMMPRSEQKLITLIITITKIHAEFSQMVEKGLEFKLFRLGAAQEVQMVERLFRILVILNKIKKDREKVRIFCCDALYCLGLRAINIIYVALTCWPEIFPKHDSNNDIIVKTIVHIVMTLQVNEPYTKLNSLRKLLSTYYEYPNSGYMTNAFRAELMKNLQENAPGINTAVLILCKKMGPDWTLQYIIKGGLKHMIVTQTHPSVYEALSLLGNLLRSFPANDPNKSVSEIIDQLCDVLDGNSGCDDLQEGVVSCLLSISKFKYTQIARSVMNWQFDKDLRSATKMKLNSFFNSHDTKWWWNFIQTNFPLPLED